MKDIKKIVKETLKTKYHLNESFDRISLIESEDHRFYETINLFGQMIDEGYDENRLKSTLEEQIGWLDKLFGVGGVQANPADVQSRDKIVDTTKKGMWSQFKEYLIRRLLNMIGLEGPLADAAAVVLVEMNVLDLIAIFRSRQGCMTHSAPVVRGIMEAIVAYIVSKNVREGSWMGDFLRNNLRNTFFEYMKSEGYDKSIGNAICNFAYKAKDEAIKRSGMKLSPVPANATPPKQT